MSDLQINRDSLPERCEICHQVDYYDRYTNSCSRCKELSSNVPSQPTPKQSSQKYKSSRFWLLKHWFQVTILRFLGQHKIASIAASVMVMVITFSLISFFNYHEGPDTPYLGFFGIHKDSFVTLRKMLLSEREDLMILRLTPKSQYGAELYYCNNENDCHEFFKSPEGYWANGNKWKHDESKYSEQEVLNKAGLSSQRYCAYCKLLQSVEGGKWPISLMSVSLYRQEHGEDRVHFDYSYAEIISASKKPPASNSDDQDDYYKLANGWYIYYTGGE